MGSLPLPLFFFLNIRAVELQTQATKNPHFSFFCRGCHGYWGGPLRRGWDWARRDAARRTSQLWVLLEGGGVGGRVRVMHDVAFD
jgi:hypothetical protein